MTMLKLASMFALAVLGSTQEKLDDAIARITRYEENLAKFKRVNSLRPNSRIQFTEQQMVDYALDCVDNSHRDLVWRWRFLTAHIESRSASYNNLRFSSETNVVVSPYGGVIGTVIHRTDFENKSIFVRPGMSAGTRSSLRVHGIDGREYFGQAYGAGVNGRTTLKVRVGPKSVWGNAVGLLNAYAESGIFPADRTITIDRKTGKCRVCSSIGTIDFFGALTQSGIHFTPSESQEPSHVDDSSRSGADQRESTPSTADTQA